MMVNKQEKYLCMHQLITLAFSNIIEKFGVSSEELEQEFPKSKKGFVFIRNRRHE